MKRGEIIGIAGLMGAGRTELAMSIFGKTYGYNVKGELIKEGKKIELNSPKDAISNNIAYLSEDRKNSGLNLIQSIRENISIDSFDKISEKGDINKENKEQVIE